MSTESLYSALYSSASLLMVLNYFLPMLAYRPEIFESPIFDLEALLDPMLEAI